MAVLLASGMMIAELVPVPLQILSVKIRKKKLFSFTPIHHGYEKKGWPEQKVVVVFVAWQIALSLLGAGIAYYGNRQPLPRSSASVSVSSAVKTGLLTTEYTEGHGRGGI